MEEKDAERWKEEFRRADSKRRAAQAQVRLLAKYVADALKELRKVKATETDMTYVMLCIGRAEAILKKRVYPCKGCVHCADVNCPNYPGKLAPKEEPG